MSYYPTSVRETNGQFCRSTSTPPISDIDTDTDTDTDTLDSKPRLRRLRLRFSRLQFPRLLLPRLQPPNSASISTPIPPNPTLRLLDELCTADLFMSDIVLCPSRIATYNRHRRTVDIWDTNGTHLFKLLSIAVSKMSFSCSGPHLILVTSDTIHLYSGLTGTQLWSFKADTIASFDVSSNGTYVIFKEPDIAVIRLCDFNGAQPHIRTLQAGVIDKFAFSPDGGYIVSLSDRDGMIRLWSTATGVQVACLPHSNRNTITHKNFWKTESPSSPAK